MMKTKNLMVSFVAIVMALFFVAMTSAVAVDGALVKDVSVTVNGLDVDSAGDDISVLAGEIITVKVYFTADKDDTDVTITAEIEGDKVDFETQTSVFDVETNSTYRKVLTLKVPYELKEKKSGTVSLNIDFDGRDFEAELDEITLKIQRPSYNVDFKSINVDQNIQTGKTFPVDIVLKNTGYNDIDDLYVIVKIPALGIEQKAYFGELVAIEDDDDDDDTDTLSKRMFLTVPYNVATGAYTLEVEVSSDDLVLSKTVTVGISNKFPETVIKAGNDLIIVNPTDSVAGYRIVAESPATVSESVVFVQAGSSEKITVSPNANDYNFVVSVFALDGSLVDSIEFTGEAKENTLTSPIVILTATLAIVFLVLLVVLIVLVTKKPQKAEEFGESYY